MSQKDPNGFTLLEVLIVIAIIGLLASIVMVSFPEAQRRARIAQAQQFAESLRASLQMDMLAWWTFDESSGNTAKDSWFDQNHGTVNGALWAEGVVNNALYFDGNDYVEIGDVSSLDMDTNSFTVEVWGRIGGSGGTYVGKANGQGSGAGYFIGQEGVKPRFNIHDGTAQRYLIPDITINDNIWHHLTLVVDRTGNKMYGYLDGVEVGQTDISTIGSVSSPDKLYVGRLTAGYYIQGTIDEVRIYSAALRQSTIQQHYAEGLKGHQGLAKR